MTRNTVFTGVLILTIGLLIACSSDDEGSPTGLPPDGDLQEMAACAADGIRYLGFAVETSLILFHDLELAPPYTPPFGFGYDDETGEFHYQLALGSDPMETHEIVGTVQPLSVVEDGLQQHDNFTVNWTIRPAGSMDDQAAGSFRVLHNGLTLPPGQTETMRVIPADEIWVGPSEDCRTEFTQFELVVHHLMEGDEVQSALTSFRCMGAAADTMTGYLTLSGGGDAGTISGTYQGETYECSIDLDTYLVDCSK